MNKKRLSPAERFFSRTSLATHLFYHSNMSNTWFDGYVLKEDRTPLSARAWSSAILALDKTLKSRCFMLVPITSIRRGCPN